MKVGEFVKSTLEELFKDEKISKEQIELMKTKEYSKETFHIDYPLLAKESEIDGDMNKRYWKTSIEIYGEKYRMCNDWYEKPSNNDRLYFEKWLALNDFKASDNYEIKEFINTIRTTSMSKSYKIPLFWAFYNEGNVKLRIDEDDIYKSFKEFYSKQENKIDLENQKSTEGFENWGKEQYVKLAKEKPIKFLAEGTSEYFFEDENLFCISNKIEPYIKDEKFISLFKETIESLEEKYFKRNINKQNEDTQENNWRVDDRMPKEILLDTKNYIQNQGYNYTYNQLSNLYLSLKTKPFLILAGISGTGKSKIVRLLAESLGATPNNNRYQTISVRPDWNDNSDLIGYKNLKDQFIDGQLIKIIKEATKPENKNKPYFICLDEMNLARVEYYLSDYLSIIESRNKIGQEIITDNIINEPELKLHIPDNIYLIGTVNMDDTTFQFSRKVLDRANTIEFSDVDLENLFADTTEEEIEPILANNDFLKTTYLKTTDIEEEHREYAKEINKKIIQVNEILKKSQKQFAYRVRDEIIFYMIENQKAELIHEDIAFDYQIMQKILPAINGSENSIKEILVDLFNYVCDKKVINDSDDINIEEAQNYLQNSKYKNSAQKIIYMLKGYQNDGYISFWC